MAARGSAARRVPGSPLSGVLRASAREARRTTRRSTAAPAPQGSEAPSGTASAVVSMVSDSAGAVVWTFPTMDAGGASPLQHPATGGVAALSSSDPRPLFQVPPVVTATAISAAPVLVTIVGLSSVSVTLRVWQQESDRVFRHAPGVTVHVAAFGRPAPDTLTADHPKGR